MAQAAKETGMAASEMRRAFDSLSSEADVPRTQVEIFWRKSKPLRSEPFEENIVVDKDQLDLDAQEAIRAVRERTTPLDQNGLDVLFEGARSFNGWKDEPVTDDQLRQIYDLMKLCPTSANCCPLRIKFIRSAEAKNKLEPLLSDTNRSKTMQAPAVAIFGMDLDFYHHMPFLWPHRPNAIPERMEANPNLIQPWAIRNATLQAAYFILAVRAIGLDAGPMQGVDAAGLDTAFWSGTNVKSMFICSIGRGDEETVFKKLPRFAFDEVCEIL